MATHLLGFLIFLEDCLKGNNFVLKNGFLIKLYFQNDLIVGNSTVLSLLAVVNQMEI